MAQSLTFLQKIKQKMRTKSELRKEIRIKKKALSKEFMADAQTRCFKNLVSTPFWQQSDTILTYISYNHEMGTRYLIEEALRSGKKVAAPRVEGSIMNFYLFDSFDDLVKSEQGILEPLPNGRPIGEDGLMIMPGVAFDLNRNRIGYGGGFYDKYIEKHPLHKKIALAYDFQIFDVIEHERHDMKPDLILTETRII